MAARRKGRKRLAEWSWRLIGVVLCAFFALGLLAGLSAPARTAALRSRAMLSAYHGVWPGFLRSRSEPLGAGHDSTPAGGPVALVERKDGFYALLGEGALRGPISPDAEGDLPVLSGPALDGAGAHRLLEYAALLVRAEGALSSLVSEMRVAGDGLAFFYLQQSRTEVTIDLRDAAVELERAGHLLHLWREHMEAVAALDMTTPGEAVLSLRVNGAGGGARPGGGAAVRRASAHEAPARGGASPSLREAVGRGGAAARGGEDRDRELRMARAARVAPGERAGR